MKTQILIIAFILCIFTLNQNLRAQIVMHESGQITLQEYTDDWTKGIQIFQRGIVFFNTKQTQDYHWVTVATPNNLNGKCWIVTAPTDKNTHNFYVEGDGDVFRTGGCYTRTVTNSLSTSKKLVNASEKIDGINGIYYIPTEISTSTEKEKKRIGVSAQEVEKVLPEAIAKDENGLSYVNYDALTILLIEAHKEQRKETEVLRKTLEEHGLLEPEK